MSQAHRLRDAVVLAAATLTICTPCPTSAADTTAPPCPQSAALLSSPGPSQHMDCRLHSDGLTFDVTYWSEDPETAPRAARVMVTDAAGTAVQTINELLEPSSPAGVGFEDLDGDGRDELVIPISENSFNGAPNTRFSVWRNVGGHPHFERTQMVGQAVYPSGDGYVVTNGGALTSRDLTFYLPDGAGYTLVVSLTISAEQVEAGTGRVLIVNCVAHQQQGQQMIDMDVAQAREIFCDNAAARAIWPSAHRAMS